MRKSVMRSEFHNDIATPDAESDALDAAGLRRLLTTETLGRWLQVLRHTPSTNDEVKRLAAQGAVEGTVVVAEHQTRGRGRQGRRFVSPPGVGIYLSVLLRPALQITQLPQLTLMVAVAVADALAQATGLPIGLKWPNDVEIRGKKVAGILTEALLQAGASTAVVVGIGINVNTQLAQLPPELQPRVTSLALSAHRRFARPPLIAALLTHLERVYRTFQHDGSRAILERWLYYGRIGGRRVRFSWGAADAEGVVVGLDEDGALRVRTDEGTTRRVVSGDVTFF